jgi:hypothetical protein
MDRGWIFRWQKHGKEYKSSSRSRCQKESKGGKNSYGMRWKQYRDASLLARICSRKPMLCLAGSTIPTDELL